MTRFRPRLEALESRLLPNAAFAALQRPASSATQSTALRDALAPVRVGAGIPALAGGVILTGNPTALAVTGVRQAGTAALATDNDQFHLGSNGKAMTSTLAALLVERGYLRWNSTVAELFPESANSMHPGLRGVTLEQLLNHRSGIADPDADLYRKIEGYTGNLRDGRQALAMALLSREPAGPVGTFRYTNAGYAVAAAMMERAAKSDYESMMVSNVFAVLGMTSAGFGPPGRGENGGTQPVGHDGGGVSAGLGPSSDVPPLLNPAGLLRMSMEDWSKFLRIHLGLPVNGRYLVSLDSLTKLHTPDPTPVNGTLMNGFGWFSAVTAEGPVLYHTGSNGHWYSAAMLIPFRRTAYFAVTNQGGPMANLAIPYAIGRIQQTANGPGF